MNVNGYRFPVWLIIFVGISLLLAIISLYMVGQVVASQPDFAANPVQFSSDVYLPDQPAYCPGGTLTSEFEFQVLKPRAVLMLVETWSGDDGITVIQDSQPQYIISEANMEWRTFPLERDIPELPAGNYSFAAAVFTPPSARNPAFFHVPFAISEGCN